ncbi:zinc finger and BTB domain-containing protein 21 isoform X2 [Takifugu flavidus]|uniref:zinc finger and BTB domain-containing protein 21 isoform X2 n=1 Tax=Takifugu flavidus TaxID=433684 RepID=UPI00254493F7|nr:zinc finger and BTB domain-containing protein 21 isoform X2 [Takifugu flavidus]
MESLVHYSNPSHAPSVLAILNEQRLRGQMCDVVLVVADQRYRAHKSVLAASSSLAAIQELGYSLGIPFLTNIVSTRPNASYCVSRKRLSFSEGEENDTQTRSVIVYRVQNDAAHVPPCKYPKKSELASLPPHYARESSQSESRHNSRPSVKYSGSTYRNSPEESEAVESKSTYSYASILKGSSSKITPVRPQLTSSVSFSETEVEPIQLQSSTKQDTRKENGEAPPYHTKGPFQGQAGDSSQNIDRSGPLIKSLLRRSLSMDSPVPVFSPTLELKELQSREQSVVKLASKASVPETSAHKDSPSTPPLTLRSKYQGRYAEEPQVDSQVSIKAEPSSPLADPMDIVRITVGETLPVNLKDLQANYNQDSRPQVGPYGKRYHRPNNRRYPLKKSKANKEQPLSAEGKMSNTSPHGVGGGSNERSAELPQHRVFKCWNCLKVFRSSAGLHRHVNMYHNPEKPYACDICHKRFHTNFKVWTHCQTQHGVVQNPASSSSNATFDDKFQKKLIDIVREREIKKALLWKLKRNKHGLQSPALTKKRARPGFICPYCGKAFVFHSHYRQHLRTHPAENADRDVVLYPEDHEMVQKKDSDDEVYSCRLCNVKLSSLFEQGDHERGCRHATVCPYCGLRFSTAAVKKDHEAHCKYKKLTCLECMRSFKSSFSIWRHQVEVHNQNIMTAKDQNHPKQQEGNVASENVNDEFFGDGPLAVGSSRLNSYSESTCPPAYESENSPSFVPEDLSTGRLLVKEEPIEESVSERENSESAGSVLEEPGVWPCEKCGSLFSARKDLERHQELLCHIKPFICHICKKAFRTNFRLWSHFQSHLSTEPGLGEFHSQAPPLSPSPPLTLHNSQRPSPQASVLKSGQAAAVAAAASEEPSSPEPCGVPASKMMRPEAEQQPSGHGLLSRSDSTENQESDTLFYHASSLSALAFKRQYMCKICHRTFKTAFSLWSHEQSHSHI